jgi:hypothetical protein
MIERAASLAIWALTAYLLLAGVVGLLAAR